MAALTIQVPEEIASAAALFKDFEVDQYTAGATIQPIVRDVLGRLGLDVQGMSETAGRPERAELCVLAARLIGCADALEAVED